MITFQEVREKYPQYSDMTDDALAGALHSKFYSDMPMDKFKEDIGLGSKVDQIPGIKPQFKAEEKPSQNIVGTLEALASAGTGAVGGVVGNVAGVGRRIAEGLASHITGTTREQNMQAGMDAAGRVSQAVTYQPRTESGQDILSTAGDVLGATKLAGLNPAEGAVAASLAPGVVAQSVNAGRNAASKGVSAVRSALTPSAPEMVGVGSAMTDAQRLAVERANSLPVRPKLTKAMITRDFADQQFERETAKNPKLGEPIRKAHEDANDALIQNLDALGDMTGATAADPRAAGKAVDTALVKRVKEAKGVISAQYEKAKQAGETQMPVGVQPLLDFLDANEAAEANAGVLTSARKQVAKLATKDDEGNLVMPINDVEETRKMIGRLGKKDETNSSYANDLRTIIDRHILTPEVGGAEYQKARALYQAYAAEFKDVGVVAKLLKKKPGSADRAVALEDVFNHTIRASSVDDVTAFAKTIQAAGPEGVQAWREMQGQTVSWIKNEATKNAQRDSNRNPVVSFAGINKAVNELDSEGKLDIIFSKKDAQTIRDLRDVAADVMTAPPGSVNQSNSASIILAALDAVGMTHGIPAPIATAAHQGAKYLKNRSLKRKINEHVNPPMSADDVEQIRKNTQ